MENERNRKRKNKFSIISATPKTTKKNSRPCEGEAGGLFRRIRDEMLETVFAEGF